ncbi:MAG: pantetheine-phosphate adenylyltransferase [Ruminococcus sp.]|nr:pantetheine-phosphate adenylyltransferase [Ruminococcus sp.]
MKTKVICPGSFDPVTLGHIDIITRASTMFDHVVVGVLNNLAKTPSFSTEERIELLKKATEGIDNVEVVGFDGLLADYARDNGITAIVKGLRAMSDFEYEFQQALINKKLNPDLETVFLTCNSDYLYLSSSVVKQVASLGGDISSFVPECVHDEILKRLKQK